MSFDEKLDSRIYKIIADRNAVRKKMFGGTCYLINGNMVCGVYKEFLILRLGDEWAVEALQKPHVRPFDITGHAMNGWVMVSEDGCTGAKLGQWLAKAMQFVETLPPKQK
jgi:hypothetical protein